MVIGLLFTEFGYQIYQSNKKAEAQQPIDSNGLIKEGRTVTFEEEEKLALNSFPSLEGAEYAENMVQSFSQCLISAPKVGENSFICISNNVTDEALEGLSEINTDVEKGKFILYNVTDGQLITNIDVQPVKTDNKKAHKYSLKLSLNYDAKIVDYELVIKDKKIISISNIKESDIKEEIT